MVDPESPEDHLDGSKAFEFSFSVVFSGSALDPKTGTNELGGRDEVHHSGIGTGQLGTWSQEAS